MSWTCGTDGEWVGEPDTSGCTNIDVGGALEDLEDPDSVPADVRCCSNSSINRLV